MGKLLVLGGTGFVGKSLISSSRIGDFGKIYSSQRGHASTDITGPNGISPQALVWDIRNISDLALDFEVIIHAATPASATLNNSDPREMFEIIVQGMENVIEFASRHSVPPIILFTSSGAVYGEIPSSVNHISEDFPRCCRFSRILICLRGW